MSFDRGALAILTAVVLLSGLGSVVAPSSLTQQAGLVATPSGLTEIRAFYGGLQIGVGLFLLWCLRQQAMIPAGLLLVGLAVGGAGIARVLGMAVDGEPTRFHLVNLAVEIGTVSLVAFAASERRLRAHTTTPAA